MKKVLVYDVAASYGGAKTVLDNFYTSFNENKEVHAYFIVSKLDYESTDNIDVIKLPWCKKSWLHRLYCDYIYMPRLVKKLNVDEILSLQNIIIPRCKIKQSVYIHNVIPFTEHKFKFKEDRHLWIYQNILRLLIVKSLKKSNKIIVQTDWLKKIFVEKYKVNKNKIEVQKIILPKKEVISRKDTNNIMFFYPTSSERFKNTKIIIEACKLLQKEKIFNYEVVLTIKGNENNYVKTLLEESEKLNLPIKFIGRLNKEDVESFYRKSILLFPSYLETVGLPLLEAQIYNCEIIAANCLYAKESISSYSKCNFFVYDNEKELFELMLSKIKKNIRKDNNEN